MTYDAAALTKFTDKSYHVCRFRYIDNSNTDTTIDIGRIILGAYSSLNKNYDINYDYYIDQAKKIIKQIEK